ncbi:hypothetical protein [Pelosinus propionicus]|uniref:Acetylglutamate kinase n=1 Tax=Pelosinus propionicus DSM 13327 TaxID=1123291 RepID=A0A1I4H7Q4_9FIRM|nr:hypothetical protein [Pelosinus propionicus]SFL38308.1 hypothetical protein SAMN04490355_100322 [Pelosinus propionicus DSM 13327]
MSGSCGCGDKCGCMFSEDGILLRDCFRLLWEQHVYWTRMTIISIAASLPDLEPTTNRLLRNAPDFARVFNHFYGNRVAFKFEQLLTDHLVIAAELVNAAKAGNSTAAADAERRWYVNADEIVHFLNCINPYWTKKHMREMWYDHLALTKAEAVARLNNEFKKDIAIFDNIEKEALMMADDFSNGIIRKFCL